MERLTDEGQVLRRHVLVESRQRVEVGLDRVRFSGLEAAGGPAQDFGDIGERLGPGGKLMLPPPRVADVEGIVDPVGSRQQRGVPVQMTGDPVLLEPADVAHLPDRRLDEMSARPEHLGLRQSVEELELGAARVDQVAEQAIGRVTRIAFAHCEIGDAASRARPSG